MNASNGESSVVLSLGSLLLLFAVKPNSAITFNAEVCASLAIFTAGCSAILPLSLVTVNPYSSMILLALIKVL
jgi:hypothetical protein